MDFMNESIKLILAAQQAIARQGAATAPEVVLTAIANASTSDSNEALVAVKSI
jgi:hypothetical protein